MKGPWGSACQSSHRRVTEQVGILGQPPVALWLAAFQSSVASHAASLGQFRRCFCYTHFGAAAPSAVPVTAFGPPTLSQEPPVSLCAADSPCLVNGPVNECESVRRLGSVAQMATLGSHTCSLWPWPAAHRFCCQASRRGRVGLSSFLGYTFQCMGPRTSSRPGFLEALETVPLGSSDWGFVLLSLPCVL